MFQTPKTFWNFFTSVKSFCVKFCKFVGNSYSHFIYIYQFLVYIYLNILSNGVNFSTTTHRFPFQVLSTPIHPENENAAFRK